MNIALLRTSGWWIALLAAAGVWAYWPTFAVLAEVWTREPDYSHGWVVLPLVLYMLWTRLDLLDPTKLRPSVWGFGVIAASFALRGVGALYYLDPIEHLSLIVWLAGLALLLGGWSLLRWSAPVLLFACFLFPMPFRLEGLFSGPLQKMATTASCWLLQLFGQPTFATGNVIHIGVHKIEVVHACNGLRMIVGFLCLCTAYAILARRPLAEKGMIISFAIPIAVTCNILRITVTGFLYQYASAETARHFTHDAAGWAMMPVGLALLAGLLWYFDRLFVESETTESTILLRRPAARRS